MSAAVAVGQPMRERLEAKPDEAQAPSASSRFLEAVKRDSGMTRQPRRGVAAADGKARERRYPLHADEDLMSLIENGDAEAFA